MYGLETIEKLNRSEAQRFAKGATQKGIDDQTGADREKHTREELRELRSQYSHDRAAEVFVI